MSKAGAIVTAQTDTTRRPADMDDDELDAALMRLALAKADAPGATRKLVISSSIDRLLDEKNSRPRPA